jgi:hemoglobin
MKDITTREDVRQLITSFYKKVRRDDKIAPFFEKVDWEHHTPIIIDFWSMVLLGEMKYKGNPFNKHISLGVEQEHFSRWLELFKATIDELFSGPVADEAKSRADSIAALFQSKLGLIK